jgi:hypothetical protein
MTCRASVSSATVGIYQVNCLYEVDCVAISQAVHATRIVCYHAAYCAIVAAGRIRRQELVFLFQLFGERRLRYQAVLLHSCRSSQLSCSYALRSQAQVHSQKAPDLADPSLSRAPSLEFLLKRNIALFPGHHAHHLDMQLQRVPFHSGSRQPNRCVCSSHLRGFHPLRRVQVRQQAIGRIMRTSITSN